MQIFVSGDKVLVSWDDIGPVFVLTPDGEVDHQFRVQGDMVWMDGEKGFNAGYQVGLSEGYESGARASALEHAVPPRAVAS